MKSMTGFGSGRLETPNLRLSIQIKAWNNRFLELAVQMPSAMIALERRIREYLQSRITRGKVEVSIKAQGESLPTEVSIDETSARSIAQALHGLAKAIGSEEPIRIAHLLGFEGILSYERRIDSDALWETILPVLAECVDDLDAERCREGTSTRMDMEAQLAELAAALDCISMVAPAVEAAVKEALRKKFMELMGELLEESRILSEIAAYLAKHTVNEEIVRLRSHIAAFRTTMDEAVCGKKLDFICQEMNREANTIGSKSASVDISNAVIRMKDSIENIREQVRNIE
jgi:uncharacterized protein (TIGR00255 family)